MPAAVLAWPLRRLGAAGLLASTGLAANRWRTAALATPIVLIAMLVATQGVLQASDQRNTERVTAERVTADHVVTGRDGAPLPAGAAERALPPAGRHGRDGDAADGGLPPRPGPRRLGHAVGGRRSRRRRRGPHARPGRRARRPARGARERGRRQPGRRERGPTWASATSIHARMADTRAATLRVAAIYDRAAGLGHVVLDPAVARSHAGSRTAGAVFVAGGPQAGRSLAGYADAHPGVTALDRPEYLSSCMSSSTTRARGAYG